MCKCEEWKVIRKDKICLDDKVMEIIHYKCKLCGKVVFSDTQEQEFDWEGLK